MDPDPQFRQNRQGPRLDRPPQGPLAKLLAFLLSAAFLVLAFMFSLAALAVVAVLGAALGGWLWWQTRTLRKQMRQAAEDLQAADMAGRGSDVIEGEFIREAGPNDRLPR